MVENTVTRADLSEAVYQEVGLSRNESADLVESVLSEIAATLTNGETVKISSFGSFSVRQKGQRVGRNPKTGEEVPILPRKVLIFRASNVLKNMINNDSLGQTYKTPNMTADSGVLSPQQQLSSEPSASPSGGSPPFNRTGS
ncbi:MAG: Integration host factor subunit alpha [Alphaproteobacteria bacterium MarineAlpha11_Bin1]|nr:MAG: Integration host factor subunit alpha [Alphaproteobacteria bacterium MarineAlpha11_Bin1]|tara:strand:- start:28267 stop:28692 length:426 start_codon:yes stop_codon:yes gene_type:complete